MLSFSRTKLIAVGFAALLGVGFGSGSAEAACPTGWTGFGTCGTGGTAALANIGTSAGTLGLLNANKTDSGTNVYSGTVNFTGVFEVAGITYAWPASGLLVGTTDTQTLTNKTLTSPTINSGALGGTFSGAPILSGNVTFSGTPKATALSSGTVVNYIGLDSGNNFVLGPGGGGGGSVSITAADSSIVVSPSPITGTGTVAVGPNGVTYAKFQTVAANSLVGNPTGSTATPQAVGLGTGLTMCGTSVCPVAPVEALKTSSFSVAAGDMGSIIPVSGSGVTVTLPSSGFGSTVLAAGQTVQITNIDASNSITITNSTGGTMYPTVTSLPAGWTLILTGASISSSNAMLANLTPPNTSSGGSGCSVSGAQFQILAVNSAGTGCTPDANASVNAGALALGASGTAGSVALGNATSGTVTLQPVTGALGSAVLSFPAATDTLVGKATTDTLTNKTLTSPTINSGALGASSTATTQSANDNSTKLATTAYSDRAASAVVKTATIGWIATVNPLNAGIIILPAASTITSIVGNVETATGSTATVSVNLAASGTACSAGTTVHSGSFNANGTAATNQTLTLTTTAISSGSRLCLQTTGTTAWTSGTGVGTITVSYTTP